MLHRSVQKQTKQINFGKSLLSGMRYIRLKSGIFIDQSGTFFAPSIFLEKPQHYEIIS